MSLSLSLSLARVKLLERGRVGERKREKEEKRGPVKSTTRRSPELYSSRNVLPAQWTPISNVPRVTLPRPETTAGAGPLVLPQRRGECARNTRKMKKEKVKALFRHTSS